MAVRFRIRTSAGQELSFASHEMFEDFVRSGDLSPEDLVYDGETGSWSPARTHPIVLEIEYEKDEVPQASGGEGADAEVSTAEPDSPEESHPPAVAADAAPEARPHGNGEVDEGAEAGADAVSDDLTGGLGLDLAPVPQTTPEAQKRAFVERMQAERAASLDYTPPDQGVGGFKRQDSNTLAEMISPKAEPAASLAPRAAPAPTPPPARPAAPRPAPGAPADGSGLGWIGRVAAVLLVVGLVGGGGYVALRGGETEPDITAIDPSTPVTPIPVDPVPTPTPQPVIGTTPAAVRERAQERYLTATQAAMRDLPNLPEIWPRGRYLSAPSEYPEVLDAWQSYVSTIRAVRQGDAERYRVAYEAALDDAIITGEERAPRLAAGLAAFAASAPLRNEHFARVEALASGAIQSHSALLEAEGLILFDPGGTAAGRHGLGVGAYGRDPDSQQLLTQVLDLLAERLAADGLGPRTPDNVRQWVWDGLLNAVTL